MAGAWHRRPGGSFTDDAAYRHSPYEEPVTGLSAIRRMREQDRDGPEEFLTLASDILAVDGPLWWCAPSSATGSGPPGVPQPVGHATRRLRPQQLIRGMTLLAGTALLRRDDPPQPASAIAAAKYARSRASAIGT